MRAFLTFNAWLLLCPTAKKMEAQDSQQNFMDLAQGVGACKAKAIAIAASASHLHRTYSWLLETFFSLLPPSCNALCNA